MSKRHITIVGGGVTGMVSAALLVRQGHKVDLYETSDKLGGVLKDIHIDGEWYYNNCQYLPETSFWQEKLNLNKNLNSFPDTYSSYTRLDEDVDPVIFDDFAQPVFLGRHEFEEQKDIPNEAIGYLNLYGEFAEKLIKWSAPLNSQENLHRSCLDHMQCDRIFLPDMTSELKSLKESSVVYDQMFGIPRSIRTPEAQPPLACLPPNGYDPWLKSLEEMIRDEGVNCQLNSPVTAFSKQSDEVKFRIYANELETDVVVWCCNPTALIHACSKHILEAKAIQTTSLFGELTKVTTDNFTAPKYWQIFDRDMNLLRFYIWKDRERVAFTAEATRASSEKIKKDIDTFLKHVFPNAKAQIKGHVNQERWVNTTLTDFEVITKLKHKMLEKGIVQGAWEAYGRVAKINEIVSLCKKANCL